MPKILWDERGNPYNEEYGDCYFDNTNGLEESRYVFLEGNNLPQAWANKDDFCIGECGFGTGLNLLAIWDLFLTCKATPKRLHYYTFEGFPLLIDELQTAHKLWPSLENLAHRVHLAYPQNPQNGIYELDFSPLHVKLVIGMAPKAIDAFDKPIDAWFLDGFAPSKNPQMWSDELFESIAKHSKKDSTFASFSVASKVRKGLKKAGFDVRKKPGFGRKREMLCGSYLD